ncbi:MAG: hypothetical protein WC716_14890 [Chitinophagaceae bacterium]|jgi:YD repeat-containing protein
MKKIFSFLILLAAFIPGISSGQDFKFLPDEYSQKATATHIHATSGWPFVMTPTESGKWAEMTSTPILGYNFKSVTDIVRVAINHDIHAIVPAFRYKVSLKITKYSTDGTFTSSSDEYTDLFLSYDPDSLQKYNDLSVFKFSGFHAIKVAITGIYPETSPGVYSSSSLASAAVADNFIIESLVIEQRYDLPTKYIHPGSRISSDYRLLDVFGILNSSSSAINICSDVVSGVEEYKPVSYELEWMYIDDYKFNVTTNTRSFGYSSISSSTINYDFRKNSTRVQLDKLNFKIPVVYEHGAIVFRFRMLRPNATNYKDIEYGAWTLPDYGSLNSTSSSPSFCNFGYVIDHPHTSDSLNWQYTINFAEQGKYKNVINYFDGALKDRQTQTKINSNPNNVVIVEKVYDYEGRPSIVSLPTPVTQENLYIRKDILTNAATNKPYISSDFDLLPGCSRPDSISLLSSSARANIYYSSLNADTSGMQKFVPDAKGFPLVQTIYSPDNTNKVTFQGGAGWDQQLWRGHGTQYEYVRANQPEIDRLLGTEAGSHKFYAKQIVTDPNGQSSYSILNPAGKVVISALQGASPDDTKFPISALDNFVPGDLVCSDLLKNNAQENLRNGLSALTTIYNDGAGGNTLSYSVLTKPFPTACEDQYLWAKGHYRVNVLDDCGTLYPELSLYDSVGTFTKTTGIGTGKSYNITDPVLAHNMPKGKFLVEKKLTFSEHNIYNQVHDFVKDNEGIAACYTPEETFIKYAVEATEFPCGPESVDSADSDSPCDDLKKQMMKELYPDAKYGRYYKNGDGTFKADTANSIFTIITRDIPLITSGSTTEVYVYQNGESSRCEVEGCGTSSLCPDGTSGCSCAPGAHPYTSPCCASCLIRHCECIVFKVKKSTTAGTKTESRYLDCEINVSTKSTVLFDQFTRWEQGISTLPTLDGLESGLCPIWVKRYIYRTSASCNCGHSHIINQTTYRQYLGGSGMDAPCNLAYGTGIVQVGTMDLYYEKDKCLQDVLVPDDPLITYTPGVDVLYRYQADCITYPETITSNGKVYSNIRDLDPQTLIEIFNDEIAEALLPLHPEYCKLKNCELYSGNFEQKFSALETYQQAEAAGMFNLSDIIAKDPASSVFTANGYSPLSLAYFPFDEDRIFGGGLPGPYGTWKMDKLALANVYCGAGNDEEMLLCAATKYSAELSAMPTVNSDVKQRYFETLKAYYLSNRNMALQTVLDYENRLTGCEVCSKYRMLQSGDRLFTGINKFSVYGDGVEYAEDDEFNELPEWMKQAIRKGQKGEPLPNVPPEPQQIYNEQKSEFADAEVESVMDALKNCPFSDLSAVRASLKSTIMAGTKLTPTIIKDAITTSLGSSALNDLCHPFLVAYNLFPDATDLKSKVSNFSCGEQAMFDGISSFLNRSEIKTLLSDATTTIPYAGTTFTKSRGGSSPVGSAFENAVMDYLEYPVPSTATSYTVNVNAKVKPLGYGGYSYIELEFKNYSLTTSKAVMFYIQAHTPSTTNDITTYVNSLSSPSDVNFQNAKCLNQEPTANTYGLITQKSAIVDASSTPGTTRYYVWNDQIDLMNPAPSASSLQDAITCVRIKKAIEEDFKGADKTTYKYSASTNHPLFENTLNNYLNFKFNKRFRYQDYIDLMEGCAVTDKIELSRDIANAKLEFSSESAANAFMQNINLVGFYQPALLKYKAPSANPVVLVDLNPVNQFELLRYRDYMNGATISGVPTISGVVNYTPNYTLSSGDNLLFTRSDCGFTIPSGATGTTTSSVDVFENGTYREYKMHTFHSSASSPTPKNKVDIIATVNDYLHGTGGGDNCNVAYAFWSNELLRSKDYNTTLKQDYLTYIYSISPETHSNVVASIDPSTLGSHLSLFSGKSFTYDDPYCGGNRVSLYAFDKNPTSEAGYNLVKNTILPGITGTFGGSTAKPFPNADKTDKTPTSGGTTLWAFRKANGVYWYRYFDENHKLYNVFITPPDAGLGRKPQDYIINAVEMGPHPNTFVITVSAPAVSATGSTPALPALTGIKCNGVADFTLGSTSIVASNIILQNSPKGLTPFDSLDCEKDLMETAITNGKAAYYYYFDSTVKRISNDMMAHLINTSKDTLIYCGRQQQYQHTLYYYDLAGNLMRTVPPMGVVPITSSTDLTSIDIHREGGMATFPPESITGAGWFDDGTGKMIYYPGVHTMANYKLTNHTKVSTYTYNSLNQLKSQNTPDGGTTMFFYDAAGRQIFSQNIQQRQKGLYSYSLYDAQGRPMESGEVKLGCTYPTATTFDLTPCNITYKKRDYSDKTITAAHPDFVEYSFDEKTYPYEDLIYYIKAKSRTTVVKTSYDNEVQDLSAVPNEMLKRQENLRNRVSAIRFYNTHPSSLGSEPSAPTFGTYYSYDLSGNVKNIVYDYPNLSAYTQRYKQVDYDFDLVSGKVNMLSYNRGYTDQFYQQYDYDADNRITKVKTSNDGIIWNEDANYEYYKHGPLATMKLGNQKVQSLEYAYTIQGWLKAINGDVLNPAKDMGYNGLSGDVTYPRDVIAHSLRYFDKDYKPIGSTAVVNLADATDKDLFNGNITQQTTGIGGLGTMQRVYSYDQLQRLKLAVNTNIDDYALTPASATPANLFKSTYAYDMDGNINTLERWDGDATSPVQIDNFTYSYEDPHKNNKLLKVADDPLLPAGGNDLQAGQPDDNYTYDLIGNLKRDKQGAEHILWDRFGKVIAITDTLSKRHIDFAYDGKGNRIWKNVTTVEGGFNDSRAEYYVRDAGGNILSVYRSHSVFNRRLTMRDLVAKFSVVSAVDPIVTGGTVFSEALSALAFKTLPVTLMGTMHTAHSSWVSGFTDKPVKFYWEADPTLRSTLLFSGDAWINALRTEAPLVHTGAFIRSGAEFAPLIYSALDFNMEGRKLLELYSREMPAPKCQGIWSITNSNFIPGNHVANANSLYTGILMNPPLKPVVVDALINGLQECITDSIPNNTNFFNAVMADDPLWNSSLLRDNNGPWTAGIRSLVNTYANDSMLSAFFDTWSGGMPAFTAVATPEYKLTTVYDYDPATAITGMAMEATAAEMEDILTDAPDIPIYEFGEKLIGAGGGILDVNNSIMYGSSGDTISLAEHHIYGSSRLGVQRYDSTTIANISYLPAGEPGYLRLNLKKRVPWYSYSFTDLIDSTKKSPYGDDLEPNNTYVGILNSSRTLARRYYELTDHLGNVLATVLDRKTGAGTIEGGSLYDHWSADLASVADYYPGGMMMPGRNQEHDWSRIGAQNSPKDDEVYGKGNLIDMGDRHLDTRILRTPRTDALSAKYPMMSPYNYVGNRFINTIDPNGKEWVNAGQAEVERLGKLLLNSPNDKDIKKNLKSAIATRDDIQSIINTLKNSDKDLYDYIDNLTVDLFGKKINVKVEVSSDSRFQSINGNAGETSHNPPNKDFTSEYNGKTILTPYVPGKRNVIGFSITLFGTSGDGTLANEVGDVMYYMEYNKEAVSGGSDVGKSDADYKRIGGAGDYSYSVQYLYSERKRQAIKDPESVKNRENPYPIINKTPKKK